MFRTTLLRCVDEVRQQNARRVLFHYILSLPVLIDSLRQVCPVDRKTRDSSTSSRKARPSIIRHSSCLFCPPSPKQCPINTSPLCRQMLLKCQGKVSRKKTLTHFSSIHSGDVVPPTNDTGVVPTTLPHAVTVTTTSKALAPEDSPQALKIFSCIFSRAGGCDGPWCPRDCCSPPACLFATTISTVSRALLFDKVLGPSIPFSSTAAAAAVVAFVAASLSGKFTGSAEDLGRVGGFCLSRNRTMVPGRF